MTSWCRVFALHTLALLTTLCSGGPAAAETAGTPLPAIDQTAALRLSQAAVGRSIGDYKLFDREGRPVQFENYRGKPLLVSFIYTGCFQVCPATTRVLQKAVTVAQDDLGSNQFRVISIGFNQPDDSPAALKSFAAQYGIRFPNWEFLSPPAAIVADLARDFGFSFAATPAGFDHILQVSVVDAQGRIYRQIYGEDYSADSLTEPLRQLITGAPVADDTSLAALVERVRILCSVYDPLTGTYQLRYALVFEIAGGVTFILAIIWFFLNEWLSRRSSSKRRRADIT